MRIQFRVLAVAIAITWVGLGGCSWFSSSGESTQQKRSAEVRVTDDTVTLAAPRIPSDEPGAGRRGAPPPSASRAGASQQGMVAALRDPVEGLSDVFFALDRWTLTKEAQETLRVNVHLLRATAGWQLEIEGHCDERGSGAYNMVLGERRAQAVREALADLGIPSEQIEVTSYGKERPFCTQHTERCWDQNRRAHFVVHESLVSFR